MTIFQHALALRDSGRVEEALRLFARLADSTADPEERASLLMNEGTCHSLLGRQFEAKMKLAEARRIAPKTHLILYLELEDAQLHWHGGERAKALDLLDRLYSDYTELLLRPEHRELFEQVQGGRGMLLTELKRYREAKPLLEESLSYSSGVVQKEAVLRDLGLCLLELGDPKGAEAKFQECLRETPLGVYATMAHYYLGTIFRDEHAYAKALLEFESCLPDAEEAQIPKEHVYGCLAETARALGRSGDADRYERLAGSRTRS